MHFHIQDSITKSKLYLWSELTNAAQLTGTVEYTDCISAEG